MCGTRRTAHPVDVITCRCRRGTIDGAGAAEQTCAKARSCLGDASYLHDRIQAAMRCQRSGAITMDVQGYAELCSLACMRAFGQRSDKLGKNLAPGA